MKMEVPEEYAQKTRRRRDAESHWHLSMRANPTACVEAYTKLPGAIRMPAYEVERHPGKSSARSCGHHLLYLPARSFQVDPK